MAIKAEIMDRYLVTYGLDPMRLVNAGPIFLKAFVLVSYVAAILICLTTPNIRRCLGTKLVLAMLGIVFAIQSFFNQKLSWYLAILFRFTRSC